LLFLALRFKLFPITATIIPATGKNKRTYISTGVGGAVGAGVGAILGDKKGAAIGAVFGAGLGGYAGHRMDKQAQELEKVAETKRTEQGLIAKLKSDILFDTGKSQLKPEAKSNLQEMASIMRKYPENVLTVKGYTDSTGSYDLNERLSLERAEAVKKELLLSGLTSNPIDTRGIGPDQPIATNATAMGRQQNRRVDIEVKVDESKVPSEKK